MHITFFVFSPFCFRLFSLYSYFFWFIYSVFKLRQKRQAKCEDEEEEAQKIIFFFINSNWYCFHCCSALFMNFTYATFLNDFFFQLLCLELQKRRNSFNIQSSASSKCAQCFLFSSSTEKNKFFIFVAWMSSGHSVGLIVDSQSLSLSLTRYCFILRSFLSALNAADDDDDVDFMGISWTKEYKRCSSLPLWPRRSATLTKIFFSSWSCCYF